MIRVVFSPVFLNDFFFQGMPMAQGMASGIVHSNLNQGLSGGYDSDAEGGNHQGNIGGSFGEKAVSIFFIYLKKTFHRLHLLRLWTPTIYSDFLYAAVSF
jgi:hypothetical protein